jgi:peptidoglycan/xylan/chitin deacetylase (PgdA/CDA1 family)
MPKLDPKYPDLPTIKWYEYGFKEGLPRLLDMFDRRKVKGTSHMVGATVDLHPALAKEIVQRARSLWPRTNVGCAIFDDARAGARIVQAKYCKQRACNGHKAVGFQCILASWHTTHIGDSAGARVLHSAARKPFAKGFNGASSQALMLELNPG